MRQLGGTLNFTLKARQIKLSENLITDLVIRSLVCICVYLFNKSF